MLVYNKIKKNIAVGITFSVITVGGITLSCITVGGNNQSTKIGIDNKSEITELSYGNENLLENKNQNYIVEAVLEDFQSVESNTSLELNENDIEEKLTENNYTEEVDTEKVDTKEVYTDEIENSQEIEDVAKEDEENYPESTSTSDDVAFTISCWGDSMTEGTGAGPAVISGVTDISYITYPDAIAIFTGYKTNNLGYYGASSIDIMNTAIEYYSDNNIKNEILLLEIGSNGGWDNNYQELIEQYQEIINASGASHYIIIGDTDDPGTSIGDEKQLAQDEKGNYVGLGQTAWENALSQAFGEHFVNVRLYLLTNGLLDTGLTPTDEDMKAVSIGKIPYQLRYDWTHLNSYGYYSKAKAIYNKGVALGYW